MKLCLVTGTSLAFLLLSMRAEEPIALHPNPSLQAIIHQTQHVTAEQRQIKLIWWVPTEYWEVALKQEKALSEAQRKENLAVLYEYTVVAVAQVNLGILGGVTATGRDDLAKQIQLIIGSKEVSPLRMGDLSADAQAFFSIMKPMMGSMLGQFG